MPVFVKRIPITDRELAHPHSTANLFDLPVRWQYGMYRLAGPGFGAWRELAANRSVTEGVLAGKTESFPLLHHQFVRRCATGDVPPDVPPPVAEIIARHAPTAARMNDFCRRLFDGDLHAEYSGSENAHQITADRARRGGDDVTASPSCPGRSRCCGSVQRLLGHVASRVICVIQ